MSSMRYKNKDSVIVLIVMSVPAGMTTNRIGFYVDHSVGLCC